VTVDLAAGSATDGFGDSDTLVNVHALHGTNFGDTVTGSAGDDFIQLFAGDDQLDGGDGWDTASYSADVFWGATTADYIEADLAAGTVDGTFSGHDTLVNIEQIDGTQGDDTLLGSNGDNQLRGDAGEDEIEGRGGDTFAFHGTFGLDTIEDFASGSDIIVFDAAAFADFTSVQAQAVDDASGVTITSDAGDSVHLTGVYLAQLSSSDFLVV
jgi:serralysin